MPNTINLNNFAGLMTPSTFDRADGTLRTYYPYEGTPALPGSIKVNYGGNLGINPYGRPYIFEEYSDSPTIESAEQSTIVHRFHCDRYLAELFLLANPRGTLLVDSGVNPTNSPMFSRVLSTTIQPISKTDASEWNLTVTCESLSFGTPPDEFDIQVVELNPASEKHPRYAALSYQERFWVRQQNVADNIDVGQTYLTNLQQLPTNADPGQDQRGQALELLLKKQKGEDSFYLAGYRVSWSSYYFAPVVLNPGGYIEDPILNGGLPYQFWSLNQTSNGASIFANTALMNPNMFPNPSGLSNPPYGLSWLRQADTFTLQRTWFKLTRNWIGGPIGQWDIQWYSPTKQALQVSQSQGGLILS